MKLSSIKPGMTVYDIGKHRMGNTVLKTVTVWSVRIKSVDMESETVIASWNSNPDKKYFRNSWSKWRLTKPVLITGFFGSQRIAKRSERPTASEE